MLDIVPFTVELIAYLLSLFRRLFAKFVSSWMLLILASCVDYCSFGLAKHYGFCKVYCSC